MYEPFIWEIYEASDPTPSEESSGEVRLEEFEPPNAVSRIIVEPNDKLNLISTDGGIFLIKMEKSKNLETASSNSREISVVKDADKNVTRLVIFLITTFLGFSFLVVLSNKLPSGMGGLIAISVTLCFIMVFINDLANGKLSFETYVKSVRKLLKGLGIKWKR